MLKRLCRAPSSLMRLIIKVKVKMAFMKFLSFIIRFQLFSRKPQDDMGVLLSLLVSKMTLNAKDETIKKKKYFIVREVHT